MTEMATREGAADESPAAPSQVSGVRIRRSTRSSRLAIAPALIVLAVLAYLPFLFAQDTTNTMVNFFILLVLGMTWNVLAGYAGLVSVGQQAFLGAGAYSVLWLAQQGMDPLAALPVAAVFCGVVAIPVSWLVFRLRGGYFAIGTWAVAEVFALVTIRSSALGGGTGTNLPGLDGYDPVTLGALTYWAALAIAVLTLLGSYLMLRSHVGLALTAVRDDDHAAEGVGVRPAGAKRVVYLLAAIGAGAAGGVLAISQLNVQADNVYGVQWAAYMIFVVLIGGIGTLEGPIIGTIVFFILQQTLASHGAWYLILVGLVAVVMALWSPRGLWGIAERFGVHLFPVGYRVVRPEESLRGPAP
jgi:branched-chain amino acid transport system permease protein